MQSTFPPRPRRADRDIVALAASRLAPKLHHWCAKRGLAPDTVVLAECFSEDGYTIARRLESYAGWPVDEKLTDLLSGAPSRLLDEVLSEAIRGWVHKHEIRVPFRILDLVSLPWCAKGQVIDIDHIHATITVHPAEGRELWRGDRDNGWHVPFEIAVPISGIIGEARS